MPFWRIYSNANTFSDEQKAGLSEAITKLYSNRPDGLPAFYVVTVFTPLGDGDIFVGGKKHKDFVRITVEQIARAMPSPETEEGRIRRRGWMERINEALKPYILDREEINWEIHISETPRDLWRLNGIDPPPTKSEAEQKWKAENKTSPWE